MDHSPPEDPSSPDSADAPEILKAQRHHQRWVLLGLALIAALSISSLVHLVQDLDAARAVSLKSVRQAAEGTIEVASVYFRLVSAALGLVGGFLIFRALRIFRSGQYPPPGSWIVRDTKIRRGFKAKARGLLSVAIGLLALFICFSFPGWAEAQLAHLLSAALQTPDTPPDAYLPHVE